MSYYRNFIPGMDCPTAFFFVKEGIIYALGDTHVAANKKVVDILGNRVLAFPDHRAAIAGQRPFSLTTDASKGGLGAVLEQDGVKDGVVCPLYFLSRGTIGRESKWTSTELECGSVVWAVIKLSHYFVGD
ncbi:unnamed protein product [Discosporangium mesarthrocarpum]